MGEERAREAGIAVGHLPAGPDDAVTDVAGVRVGHSTIIRGEGPLVVGEGPVRTGVTVVCPREGFTREDPVFAGSLRLNGNGAQIVTRGRGTNEPKRRRRLRGES